MNKRKVNRKPKPSAKRKVNRALAPRPKMEVAKMAPGAMKTFREAILARYPKADIGEVQLLFLQAKRMGLDPLSNHLYLVPRWNNDLGRVTSTVQVGIDALRLAADRGGTYAGCATVMFDEGKTLFEMVKAGIKHPTTARATGYKIIGGMKVEVVAEVTWDSRVQKDGDGNVTRFWWNDPYGMLGKCADALMLRKGWPMVNSDAYIPEEMPGDHHAAPAPTADQIKKVEQKNKALPAPGAVASSPAQQKMEDGMTPEKVQALRSLHAEGDRLGLDKDGLHAYIHTEEKVPSLRDLTVERLAAWVTSMREIERGSEKHLKAISRVNAAKARVAA